MRRTSLSTLQSLFVLAAAAIAIALIVRATGVAAAAPPAEVYEPLPAGASVELVAGKLDQPVALAFDPAGRLFFTERSGQVRLYSAGVLQAAPVITFTVDTWAARGLLGIAIDPDFGANHYVYVYYSEYAGDNGSPTTNKVVRFTEQNGHGSGVVELFSAPDLASFPDNHIGGNIHFGPDDKLYITIGDDGRWQTAQDVTARNGKLHRINRDGSIPADNPVFTQSGALPSLYARGLRNAFDFAFDPTNSSLWASDNGPDCDDELNRILPGGNYGWRTNYPCDDANPSPQYNTLPPAWWTPAGQCCDAPTGVEFYEGQRIPAWSGEMLMCSFGGTLPGGKLRHMRLDDSRTQLTAVGVVQGVTCNMDLETGPDGALYYIEGGGFLSGAIKRIAAPSCAVPFGDIAGDTFEQFIAALYCDGVVDGYSDNTFRPYQDAGRATLARWVVKARGWAFDLTGAPHFSDVPPGHPDYNYVETAYNHGVISGYDPADCPADPTRRCFKPDNNVTRGQMSKMIINAMGWPIDAAGTPTFRDVPASNPFYPQIETIYRRGIVSGYDLPGGEREFRWYNNLTRGQLSKVLYNAVNQPSASR